MTARVRPPPRTLPLGAPVIPCPRVKAEAQKSCLTWPSGRAAQGRSGTLPGEAPQEVHATAPKPGPGRGAALWVRDPGPGPHRRATRRPRPPAMVPPPRLRPQATAQAPPPPTELPGLPIWGRTTPHALGSWGHLPAHGGIPSHRPRGPAASEASSAAPQGARVTRASRALALLHRWGR